MTPDILKSWPDFTDVILLIQAIALTFALGRLIMGPTLPDRIVSLDLIGIITAGIIAVLAIEFDQPVYLIVSVVLALIAFIGTIAFAYYIAKRGVN